MVSIGSVLSAVTDFLNDAKNIGIVKEFNLTLCDVNYEVIPGIDELLSQFLQKVNILPIPSKNSSSDEEYIVIEDEKKSESDNAVESPIKENSDMQIDINEVSPESCNSSMTEQVSEEEKKPENVNISDVPEQVSAEVESPLKKHLIQINVDTNEIKRRISAFITRKRKEVDEWNVQEFCGRSYVDEQDPAWEESNSCARVDAVFVPRRGCKSHIKVTKVQNVWGPQTNYQPEMKKIKQEPVEAESCSSASYQAIDERLVNMETHLKLKTDDNLRKNIFQRIKDLENRILLLESSSPEYIHILNPDYSFSKNSKNADEKIYTNYTTDEIQKRIESIKQSLKRKNFTGQG